MSAFLIWLCDWQQGDKNLATGMQALKFQIECTCLSGIWIVKITCPNVPFTCLKYTKPMQLMWKSEINSCPSDKSCRYSTCPPAIFTHLRQSDEWNFEPWGWKWKNFWTTHPIKKIITTSPRVNVNTSTSWSVQSSVSGVPGAWETW